MHGIGIQGRLICRIFVDKQYRMRSGGEFCCMLWGFFCFRCSVGVFRIRCCGVWRDCSIVRASRLNYLFWMIHFESLLHSVS
jgi:hypothetical protein